MALPGPGQVALSAGPLVPHEDGPWAPSLYAASPPAALGLRNPLGVQSPYSAAFGMAHPAVNGDMAGTGAYASLHLMSPQLNGAAAAVGAGSYGRSPLVREPLPCRAEGAVGRELLSPAVPSRWATTRTPTCASQGWQPACKWGLRGNRKWGRAGLGAVWGWGGAVRGRGVLQGLSWGVQAGQGQQGWGAQPGDGAPVSGQRQAIVCPARLPWALLCSWL